MPAAQERLGSQCPYQCSPHVLLRVPRIALCSKKGLGSGSSNNGRLPLEQFVQRTDGQTHGNTEEYAPASGPEHSLPDRYFARHHIWHESLCKVSNPVVIIS